MWLRDSANQVAPYMGFARQEPDRIGALIRGLVNRHADSVLLDPHVTTSRLLSAMSAMSAP